MHVKHHLIGKRYYAQPPILAQRWSTIAGSTLIPPIIFQRAAHFFPQSFSSCRTGLLPFSLHRFIMASTQHQPQATSAHQPRDSARNSPEPNDQFHSLVHEINKILGPSNGIDSAGVDVQHLEDAMSAYKSNEKEWHRYAFADKSRAYTRNLVDYGNGKSNLLILVWTPGKSSPIHDHANAHCVMKILKGELKETLYGWPCQRVDNPAACDAPFDGTTSAEHTCSAGPEPLEPAKLHVQRETKYGEDQVTYMSDKLGLHRIGNPSDSEFAVSLHLYTVCNTSHAHRTNQ